MNTSGVWKYFKKSDPGDKAQCLINLLSIAATNCHIAMSDGSTKGMWTQLKSKHHQEYSALVPTF
jgi:hypothetical protein